MLNRVLDDGVESWWLDLTEPEGDPDGTQYYDGGKAKVHNSFCLMNVRLYNEITLVVYEVDRLSFQDKEKLIKSDMIVERIGFVHAVLVKKSAAAAAVLGRKLKLDRVHS